MLSQFYQKESQDHHAEASFNDFFQFIHDGCTLKKSIPEDSPATKRGMLELEKIISYAAAARTEYKRVSANGP